MMIAKVGQVVLFRTMTGEDLAALVVAVWADGAVNLCVFDRDGSTFARHGVTLARGREAMPLEAHFEVHFNQVASADHASHAAHGTSASLAEAGRWASLHSAQATEPAARGLSGKVEQ